MDAMEITFMQAAGLVLSPAFSHVAIVPAGAATIYVGGQNGVDASGSVVSSDVRAVEPSDRKREHRARSRRRVSRDVVQWVGAPSTRQRRPRRLRTAPSHTAHPRWSPALVTAARVAGLGVPGALIEVGAIAQ